MRKRQINGYEAGKRVKALWVNYEAELDSIEEMAVEKVALDKTLDKMDAAAAIQSDDITGEALEKQELKDAMGKIILVYAQRARVKAFRANKPSLAQELSHSASYFTHADAELVLARATATKDKIKHNLTVLTNITPDNVVEMETAIEKFRNVITAPQEARKEHKVIGTDEIETLSYQLDQVIMNIGDLIHSYFPDSELSQLFDAQSKLGSSTSRHNHVVFNIETADTHEPIATATATKVKTNRTLAADSDGTIEFEKVLSGKQEFIIKAEGYKSRTIYVIVTRSTTTELVVQLEQE